MGTGATCHTVLQRILNDGPGEALDIVLRGWHQPGFLLGPLVPPRSPLSELLRVRAVGRVFLGGRPGCEGKWWVFLAHHWPSLLNMAGLSFIVQHGCVGIGAQRDQGYLGRGSPCVPASSDSEFLLSGLGYVCRTREILFSFEHLQVAWSPYSHILSPVQNLSSPGRWASSSLPLGARPVFLSWLVMSCFRKQSRWPSTFLLSPFSPVAMFLLPATLTLWVLELCVWCFFGGKPSCPCVCMCLFVAQKACHVARCSEPWG